ncbi:phosphoribosyltransferase [Candidatus Saccharibacteria bacterium]|nr:phosphoribosyltransferase [Candidatus Saccharibacteria bacterium]
MNMNASAFQRRLREVAYDPIGEHHEFRSGLHGRKYDLSKIRENGQLYGAMLGLNVELIETDMSIDQPLVIAGVDSGTIEFAHDVAAMVGHPEVQAVDSEKDPESGMLSLTDIARDAIWALHDRQPKIVILDDVGTTGGSLVPLFVDAINYLGIDDVVAQYTVQRSAVLRKLEGYYPYRAVIVDPQVDYTEEACVDRGFCSRGSRLIPYTKPRPSDQ